MIAQMAARLHIQSTLETVIDTVLHDSIALVGSQFGDIQLLDEDEGLVLVGQQGFNRSFLLGFRRLTKKAATACMRAVLSRAPVVIKDVHDDADYAPYLDMVSAAGYRAVLSMPLLAHTGACIGVVSTHFRQVHAPNPIELDMLHTYGRIAADRIAAMIGNNPVSLQARGLYERMLDATERPRRRDNDNINGNDARQFVVRTGV